MNLTKQYIYARMYCFLLFKFMYYDYIQISKINDFVFCPRSLYFHGVYESFDSRHYKSKYQIAGSIAHKTIDNQEYSTRKNILQGKEIFSSKYGILGKIDIYDSDKKELIERKRQIKKIYDGYLFQLYAQKLCLEEMGYEVKKMSLYSLVDNKKYNTIMTKNKIVKFNKILKNMRDFDLSNSNKCSNYDKCDNCIYRELCCKDV